LMVRMNKKILYNLIFILRVVGILSAVNDLETQEKFLDSFIHYYDFTTVGRYTHEYHPFLFEKSSYSLDELEQSLEARGLSIKGRVVIAGYEEAAVPSYYTNYKVCTGSKINDEVRIRDSAGWTQQLHNKFGLMTGFLFRDVSLISNYCRANKIEPLFEHINLHTMPIYDRDSWLFQRHAFGNMFRIMEDEQNIINFHICRRNTNKIFDELINFWRTLYEYELRFGNRQVLGTQDVLFSIAHAEHLYRSNVPLLKYYVGPDITYPIKVTSVQKESATYNAQAFVKKFVKHLKAIDNKATAYIFCSFVDGVGKSTLLGNVQNYKKYGNWFIEYDAVDNSSSQLAQLYECGNDVFIADLPAQMSHFTYKPDGMVYFDPLAAGISECFYEQLVAFVVQDKSRFIAAYEKEISQVKMIVVRDGWFSSELSDQNFPQKAFIKNLLLLKRQDRNTWIPFSHGGKHYLFHRNNPERIRMLVKLELADSVGLKNYEPEQMLFFEGVRFPLAYNLFIDDLVGKLQERGIQNIVFVDFLSMYPRSSRENIRINYLLQQLSLLYNNFSIEQSSYGTFVNDAQLFYRLKKDKNKRILDTFCKESLIRLALYTIMKEYQSSSIDGIKLQRMTHLLSQKLQAIPENIVQQAGVMAKEKLKREVKLLGKVHGKTKNFINIQELNFDDVITLNKKLQKFFVHHVKHKRMQALWENLEGEIVDSCAKVEGHINKKVKLSNGKVVQLLYVFSPECKNVMILAPVLRLLRSSWYAALFNLIGGTSQTGSKSIKIEKQRYFIPPIWIKKTQDGKIAILRRLCKKYEKKIKPDVAHTVKMVNLPDLVVPEWGEYDGIPYLLNSNYGKTDRGMFAFGCDLLDYSWQRWPGFNMDISYFVKNHKEKEKPDIVMTTEKLWKEFENHYWWKCSFKKVVEQAQKNEKNKKKEKEKTNNTNGDKDQTKGQVTEATKGDLEDETKDSVEENRSSEKIAYEKEKNPKDRIYVGRDEYKPSCRFVVRALATVEMVMKDANSDIALRRGNKKDFVAALTLFEKILLPSYFDIVFEKNLFDNYGLVKPLIDIKLR